MEAQEVPRLNLRLKDETPVAGESIPAMTGTIRCDSKGNIYLRPSVSLMLLDNPVIKISPEGKVVATYSLDSVPGFLEAQLWEFALGPRDRLYTLVGKPVKNSAEIHILAFDEEGDFDSGTQLAALFYADHIVVLADGNFLVAGSKPIEQAEGDDSPRTSEEIELEPVEPYTAIFDRAGRIVTELTFEADAKLRAPDSAQPAQTVPVGAISSGKVVSGYDGSLYVMRAAAKPLIHVLSPAGALLRTLEITPPSEKATLLDVRSGGPARLLLMFAEKIGPGRWNTARSIFSLVDAETGERLYDYQSTLEVGGIFACYARDEFIFLGRAPGGGLTIRRASPR